MIIQKQAKITTIENVEQSNFIENFVSDYAKQHNIKEPTIGLTSGGFDPIHPGHMSCIAESSENCDILIVAVNGDRFIRRKKVIGFMPLDVRCEIVSYVKGVDIVISFDGFTESDMTCKRAIEAVSPHVFFKGGDRIDAKTIPEWDLCKEKDVEIVTGMGIDKVWSSGDFLGDYVSTLIKRDNAIKERITINS